MIFIDASEGVSADMLLAAMIGFGSDAQRTSALGALEAAGKVIGLRVHLGTVEDGHDKGLTISCTGDQSDARRRTFSEVTDIIGQMHAAQDRDGPRSCDLDIVKELFKAEAAAHHSAIEEVHLHEAGRPSGLLNIFGIGLVHGILKTDGAGDFVCSTITTGKGIVVIGHGAVRVPTPASAELLRGLRHSAGSDPGERATPTGLAALRTIVSRQSDDIPRSYIAKSVGFGTRRFGGRLGRTAMYRTEAP